MSFLEMLDVVNETLVTREEEPIAFDHDCREGICGACGLVINGRPHGPRRATTACQLHMRHFADGDEIWIEPWRARAFPVLKDLVVDRGAFDRIIQAGGFITVRTGSAPEANAMPVPKRDADRAMDAAACIGCGACVAACPNASAMLFVAAKVSHLGLPAPGPAGALQRASREMVGGDGRGGIRGVHQPWRVHGGLPQGDFSVDFIAQLNRDLPDGAALRPPREGRRLDAGRPRASPPPSSPSRRSADFVERRPLLRA